MQAGLVDGAGCPNWEEKDLGANAGISADEACRVYGECLPCPARCGNQPEVNRQLRERIMNRNLANYLTIPLAAVVICATVSAIQAQTPCKPFMVNAPVLQVRKDANTPGAYVTALQKGDIACVSDAPRVGPQKFGYVVSKTTKGGAPVKIGGWASVIFMSQQADAGAATAPQQKATQAAPTKAAAADDQTLRFEQPIPYGAQQVKGKTLKELVEGQPMFPPIEGLPANLWQKNCSSCHKWNAKTLCEQGRSYLPRAAEIFRHQHPYGGAYKLSLMRWAKTGCN